MAEGTGAVLPLAAETYGGGGRLGLALHCGLGHRGLWKGVAEALEEPLALMAVDLPGHGSSPDWGGRGDYMAATATAALARIGEAEPFDLIGHSGGAVAALQIALARPDLVRTLTLIEPVLFAAAKGTPEYADFLAARAPYAGRLAAGDRAGAAAAFTRIWGTGQPWEALDARTRAYMEARIHLIEAAMPALDGDNFGILAEDRLEALEMPAMIIIGTESPPIMAVIAETIAGRLPDVGLAEVPGAGHLVLVTHPAQVTGLIDVNLSRD